MSEDVLNKLFSTFKVSAEVFHNGQYCGNWSIDTSGASYLSFHVVTHGRCYLMVEGVKSEIIELNQGDLVLFPHDAKHCISNEPNFTSEVNSSRSNSFKGGLVENATGLVCGYFVHQHPMIKQLTDYLPPSIIINNNSDESGNLSTLVKLLIEESLNPNKGSTFILEKLSECVLASLFREYLSLEKGLFAALANERLNPSIVAIIKQPENKWTLAVLAELSHMSRSSYSELFKKVVGLPVMEYVTQWRVSVAYRLLQDQSETTLSVALQVGYENESSFSKAFKRVLGLNPGEVRAKPKATHP